LHPDANSRRTHHLDIGTVSSFHNILKDSNAGSSRNVAYLAGFLGSLHARCIHLTSESTHHASLAAHWKTQNENNNTRIAAATADKNAFFQSIRAGP
jgi:hypothetical protein